MARKTANAAGLSTNAAGYYRRYLGLTDDGQGGRKPLHLTYSRDITESRWIDAIWVQQRAKLARLAGVPVTRYVWPAETVSQIRALIEELVRLEREAIRLATDRLRMEREIAIHERLAERASALRGYAVAGLPPHPVVSELPRVSARDVESLGLPVSDTAVMASIEGLIDGTPRGKSFSDALDACVEVLKTRPIEASTRNRSIGAIAELKRYAAKVFPSIDLEAPMTSITYGDLERLTNFIKGRPNGAKGTPLAPLSVKTSLQKWRETFDWIDSRHEDFGWVWPRRAKELFGVDLSSIMTKKERDDDANGDNKLIPTYSELKALLSAATDHQRMIMLTAVFGAQGQKELAVTRRDEFNLDRNKFVHNRNKTGVRGAYYIPDELVKLIRTYWSEVPADEDDSAFLSEHGLKQLITDTGDSVRQWFTKLRDKVRARDSSLVRENFTFYAFRRVLCNYPDVIAAGLTEIALSQTHKDVGRKKYNPNRDSEFDRLWPISQKMAKEMRKAGVFDW